MFSYRSSEIVLDVLFAWGHYFVQTSLYDFALLPRPQSIVWITSAAHPNLQLKTPTFLGSKNEVSTTFYMWLLVIC